jgi:hypothetical protein
MLFLIVSSTESETALTLTKNEVTSARQKWDAAEQALLEKLPFLYPQVVSSKRARVMAR